MDERAHRIIDCIYAASIQADAWHGVVSEFSGLFGGSPVLLGHMIPGEFVHGAFYHEGLAPEYAETYLEALLEGLPYSTRYPYEYQDRFGSLGEVLGHVDLAASDFYLRWLKPQGLAAIWPAGAALVYQGEIVGGITVFRREGEKEFTPEDLGEADPFLPHLRRALEVYRTLHGAQRVRLALAEVVDRLPTGVILLNARRAAVLTSRSADRILAQRDGLRLDEGGPSAYSARDNATLQRRIADAMDSQPGREFDASGFVSISRPSGKRPFPVMVTPLLAAPAESMVRDAVVAVLVSDPDSEQVSAAVALEELYDFTHSEAELVRLLSRGKSLEEAAEARGVSLNTAKSHLKHAFAKTGTSRQGELVRLVISGVASLRDERGSHS